MRILFLCHRFPYPPDHGARIRAFHFIRHLGQRHSITVATLAHTRQEVAEGCELKRFCEDVLVEVLPAGIRWLNAVRALSSSEPSSLAYFCSAALKRRIDESLKLRDFDVIITFCSVMAQYVLHWQGGYRILDYVDIDSVKWADYSRRKPIPLRWGYHLEAKKLRRFEARIARHFHHCAVISQGELEEFQRFDVDVPCTIIQNGVDTEYFSPDERDHSGGSGIVFVGRMDYFPNVDGINYFVKEIFPLVRQAEPNAELWIVGSNPTTAVRDLATVSNVRVTGHVPDVRRFMRNAAVSIAPLRIARGTQNKILEAMATGIPVVASPEAAKGVEGVPGRDLMVAGTPTEFANAVIGFLHNRPLGQEFATAGRRQIETAYTWDASLTALDCILQDVPNTAKSLWSTGPKEIAPRQLCIH